MTLREKIIAEIEEISWSETQKRPQPTKGPGAFMCQAQAAL